MKREQSELYKSEIHQLIPGGAHTYSKGDDQFPENAPAAISHGKGAYVWDIDGNKYLDCSMGFTSVSLGHAYEPVLKPVRTPLLLPAKPKATINERIEFDLALGQLTATQIC